MKAARLHKTGETLSVEDVREPELRPDSVIIKAQAVFVGPSAGEVLSGHLPFQLPSLPFTPGMDTIGVIEKVGEEVAGLKKGCRVYGDHFFTSRLAGIPGAAAFIGYFGMGPGSAPLLESWHDGAYAEKVLLPAECLTPINDDIDLAPALLCRLGYLGTAYAGLQRGGFTAGQSLIVNGATGVLGVSAVLLALAMGAAKIVALGRKQKILDDLKGLDAKRVVPVAILGDAEDAKRISAAAQGADMLLDTLGYLAEAAPTLNALLALRPKGTAVFVGGVQADLPVNYGMMLGMELTLRGSLWFSRRAAAQMLRMIAAGTLDLSPLKPAAFPLDQVNDAIAAAAGRPGGFEHVAIIS